MEIHQTNSRKRNENHALTMKRNKCISYVVGGIPVSEYVFVFWDANVEN